jgi:cardiolipin synthase
VRGRRPAGHAPRVAPLRPRLQLLVDGEEFRQSLAGDIPEARQRVLVQTLTFEGDRAGRGVAELVAASPAADRRIVVDCFTKHWINDKGIRYLHNRFDRALQEEARATDRMWVDLGAAGAQVRFTNPLGPFMVRGPARNHKKLVILDERIAYIGGINFSDHNFAWRDVMVRMEDPDIACFLACDFDATWQGRNQATSREFPGITLHIFDGKGNARAFALVQRLLRDARQRVDVDCGYLTPPFSGWLAEVRARGLPVRVIMPATHNWPAVRDHVRWAAAQADIELRLYDARMIHLKSMLIDDRVLIVGSANFDLWSYRFQQEVIGIVTDPGLVADFRRRVLDPDVADSRVCDRSLGPLAGRLATFKLRAVEAICRVFNG